MNDQSLSPSAIIVMEHIMRSVREATDMDAVDRALLNLVLHQALSTQQRLHDANMQIQHAEIERRVAMIRSLRAEIGKMQMDLDAAANRPTENAGLAKVQAEREELQAKVDELAATLAQARRGYEALANEQRNMNESLVQAYRERDEYAAKIAELEAALATARLAVAQQVTVMPDPVVEAPVTISIETAVTDALQPVATNGNGNATGSGRGKRYVLSTSELKQRTTDRIKELAKRFGRTPTIVDYDVTCDEVGLPNFQTVQSRLNLSWTSLVLAAGLTPNKPGKKVSP